MKRALCNRECKVVVFHKIKSGKLLSSRLKFLKLMTTDQLKDLKDRVDALRGYL